MAVSGYQFAHLECHSKGGKGGKSVSYILAEARRDLEAVPHVDSPQPEQVVYGLSINALEQEHADLIANAKVALADGKTRKISSIQQTLMSAIFSHPATMEQVKSDPKIANQVRVWEQATIDWLKQTYGEQVKTVIRHTDEKHAHLHAYIIPEDLKAKNLHPGHSAKASVKQAGVTSADIESANAKAKAEKDESKKAKLTGEAMLNRRGDQAYKQAMREWQDSYFESVGIPCGLSRLGPGKRRLTREQWKTEKVQVQALSLVKEQAKEYVADVKQQAHIVKSKIKQKLSVADSKERESSAKIAEANQRLEKAKRMEAEAIQVSDQIRKRSAQIERQANRLLKKAEKQAEKLGSFASHVRSFLDGFRRSKIEDEAHKKAQALVDSAIAQKDIADRHWREEHAEHKRAKERNKELLNSVSRLSSENLELRSKIHSPKSKENSPRLKR